MVIDEIQFLAKSSDKSEIVKFLIKLRIELGIPVIYVGTFELEGVYDDLPMAYIRKGSSLGDEYFEPYELKKDGSIPSGFHNFIEFLFDSYQVSNSKTEYNEELSKTFYNETGGIIFVIINLFILIQQRINFYESTGKKNLKISKKLISEVAPSSFRQLKPYIRALVTGNKEQLKKMKDIDVSKYRLRDLSSKYKPGEDIEKTVADIQRRHGLEGQLFSVLRQATVPEKIAGKIVKAVMDGYNGEGLQELTLRAMQMNAEQTKSPERDLQLSPQIERDDIDLDKVDLSVYDAFVSSALEAKNDMEVVELLSQHNLTFDLEKELDL